MVGTRRRPARGHDTTYGTADPLEAVLGPGYFEAGRGQLRPGELIFVSAGRADQPRRGSPHHEPAGQATRAALVMVSRNQRGVPVAVRLVQDFGGPDGAALAGPEPSGAPSLDDQAPRRRRNAAAAVHRAAATGSRRPEDPSARLHRRQRRHGAASGGRRRPAECGSMAPAMAAESETLASDVLAERERVLRVLREQAPRLRSRGITSLSLFGSRARGEAGPESDVDLLIETDPESHLGRSDLLDLREELGDLLVQRVDFAFRSEMRPWLQEWIEDDRIEIF